MAELQLPDGIGPHEGRECALMLAGQKPMAMFCDVATHSDHFPESEFAPHVEVGTIIRREEFYSSLGDAVVTRCLFFALPAHEWRIEEAHLIQKAIFTGQRCATAADDAQLGYLLGYEDADITAFLNHVRSLRTR